MAVAEEIEKQEARPPRRPADIELDLVLGDDYLNPDGAERDRSRAHKRGFIRLNRSPLARKIITFNLIALILLVAGVLYLNPSRDSLVFQRANDLVTEAELIADVYEATMRPGDFAGDAAAQIMAELDLRGGSEIYVFNRAGQLIASTENGPSDTAGPVSGLRDRAQGNVLTGFLNRIWDGVEAIAAAATDAPEPIDPFQTARTLHDGAVLGVTQVTTTRNAQGDTVFTVVTPIFRGGIAMGTVGVTSAAGEIDSLVRAEREQVLQMFVIGVVVSIGLSLTLASTIANPLADLATAAEIGTEKHAGKFSPERVRIPDLTARPDEIGRLSAALRGMVTALYERIEGNEQFAADVAHEIKNPLASLRSAVGTLRLAKRNDQRERLLDVIDHDVRRLDRLVSDIANASRLDSELVKEEEEEFDLLVMLKNLTDFLGEDAKTKDIEFISDLPGSPVHILGLEARLAQVFVNLISNAISFCEAGDAIRVWVRRSNNRVLVVVEDTGPGIPDGALKKVFQRFYSERPEKQFGNNSGLGLAISKQIVEAHGGVIWAENIRPTDADAGSDPLGARFVVGLPV